MLCTKIYKSPDHAGLIYKILIQYKLQQTNLQTIELFSECNFAFAWGVICPKIFDITVLKNWIDELRLSIHGYDKAGYKIPDPSEGHMHC